MSVAIKVRSSPEPASKNRTALGGTAGNGSRASAEPRASRPKEGSKKPRPRRPVSEVPRSLQPNNGSVDSSCSLGSCSSGSSVSVKTANSNGRVRRHGLRSVKIVPHGAELSVQSPSGLGPVTVRRCDWITSNSDPLYISFHDEEWGVPVHDDRKLFELLVLSQALAELSWPAILQKRGVFRKAFDGFDPSSVANFSEKKLVSLNGTGTGTLLSEPKLRAVVDNAKQVLKVQQEFGSFSNYCWNFVNHKPLKSEFRYARQVPVKTAKAELISKDMMQWGFRCVGPTVVYSFMQVAGMVNGHLITCFRFQECYNEVKKDAKPRAVETQEPTKALGNSACLSHD